MAACSNSDPRAGANTDAPKNSSGTIVVGAIISKTGPYAGIGALNEGGFKAAVKILNDAGGIDGKQIVLNVKDDGSDPVRSIAAAKDLVAQKPAIVFSGAITASVAGVAPVLGDAKLVNFTAASGSQFAGKGFPYTFQVSSGSTAASHALVAAVKQAGYTSIATITPSVETGQQQVANVKKYAEEAGIKVTGQEQFDIAAQDVTAQLSKLKSGHPQAIVGWATQQPLTAIANGLRDLGWKDIPLYVSNEAASGDLSKALPAEVQAQVRPVVYRSTVRVDDKFAPGIEKFAKTMEDQGSPMYGLGVAAISYDILAIAKYAIEKAGSTDAAKVVEALQGMTTATDIDDSMCIQYPGCIRFSPEEHGAGLYDFTQSNLWAIADVTGGLTLGTMEGKALNFG